MRIALSALAMSLSACTHAQEILSCPNLSSVEAIARAGGFSAPLGSGEEWKSIGLLRIRGEIFCPFEYSREWGSGHVSTRLVMFSTEKYLGSYSLTMPKKIIIRGTVVVITSMDGSDSKISFASGKLPSSIFVDGESSSLFL